MSMRRQFNNTDNYKAINKVTSTVLDMYRQMFISYVNLSINHPRSRKVKLKTFFPRNVHTKLLVINLIN